MHLQGCGKLGLFVLVATFTPLTACWGACLALPDVALRPLDDSIARAPKDALREAHARLDTLRTADDGPARRLQETQLFAIIAEASMLLSRPQDVRAAVDSGNALLATMPRSPDSQTLAVRLRISASDAAEESSDSAAAVTMMDEVLAGLSGDTLERACALISRAEGEAELNAPDRAATDALEAYRIAAAAGWSNARVGAAYALTTVYRRAGLLQNAAAMNDEVLAYATRRKDTQQLSDAEYTRGRILTEMHRYDEAVLSLAAARKLSVQLGDGVGIAASDAGICVAEIARDRIDAAARACASGDQVFAAAQRRDMLVLLAGLRGRIALARGDFGSALADLDRALTPASRDLLPYLLPQFMRDRARVHEKLRDYSAAYADMKQAFDMEQAADTEQRARAVAVLSAAAAADRLSASNRALEQRLATERNNLLLSERTHRDWVETAVLALALCGLLLYLLLLTRRQSRSLRRQQTIARTIASHAPDALLLLDERRMVSYANRHLFGFAAAHEVGRPLGEEIPPDVRAQLDTALDQLVSDSKPCSFPVVLSDEEGATRHFDLSAAPVFVDGKLVGMTLRALDVTGVRRLEREVLEVASRERQKLSSELHEGLGQELTGVLLLLRSAATAIERGLPTAPQLVEQVSGYVAQCVSRTRELARGLSPVQIERGSLSVALERLAGDVHARFPIQVSTRSQPSEIRLSEAAADHLYRIASEAVTNAAQHSRCTSVDVSLSANDSTLELTVLDDGVEPPLDGANPDGFGVKMMAYRARLLGGSLRFSARASGGTCLTVSVPLSQVSA
jgi:PAS domain S-box-containing protein